MEPTLIKDIESFIYIAEFLMALNYKLIQHMPTHQIRNRPGRELQILQSFIFKNKITLFKGSVLEPAYKKYLRKKFPALNVFYNFFFQGKELSAEALSKFFNEKQLESLNENQIINCSNGNYISKFRFVPIDDLIIVSSTQAEFDTPGYVYIGEDSILFHNLLKQEVKEKVNNALEIGCGTGFLFIWLSKFAQSMTSVDISNQALKITNLNAKLNKVTNIITKQSDVYSNVTGKYDLIISNPPYVFLPDENAGRTFAFGGNLGLEILEKILLGLDEHLNDEGVCYMIFFSYIKDDGTNTAYELISKMFSGTSFSIMMKQIDYYPIKHCPSFYKQRSISHTIRYLIKVQKSPTYKMDHVQIKGISKVIQKLKIKF